MTTDLLPQQQLAHILAVSERTLERWRVEGCGPAYLKAGRRVLYRRSDVDQWLDNNARTSTSDRGACNV
ncbi:helix-turn-helix transcriptional regulator [Bradyrhizobium sp. DOA9]|uniref:helix-turn-helix transcriptional regulator n=1 Tax=Bradyrhizobium sp. DOA9 TaxID=1126627 RepID=UPI00046822C9|nr:helix-turn-helix domain-containing protein [Bradyrhizobium sp. DOA9]